MNVERLLVVLAVLAVAVMVARLQNRGAAVARHRRTFVGLAPGVYVFASRTCDQCETVEALVEEAIGTGRHRTIWWDESPHIFESNDIDRVPAIAQVGSDGAGWVAVGIPSAMRLRRWLGGP